MKIDCEIFSGVGDNNIIIRSIIIDRKPPTFSRTLPKIIATEGKRLLKKLNIIQQEAVLKALTVNDYLLLKGLPGKCGILTQLYANWEQLNS